MTIAGVALANDLNLNLPARWRRDYLTTQAASQSPALIPMRVMERQLAPSSVRIKLAAAVDGQIDVRVDDMTVIIRGVPNEAILGMVLRELMQCSLGAPK